MRKVTFFTTATLLLLLATETQAQVRIGGLSNPHSSAILDLNATDATNNGTHGLALPRVELTATNVAAPVASPVNGLQVYNTATDGSGGTAVSPGIYYWDGAQWVATAQTIPTEPWNVVGGTTAATTNAQNIYQAGKVGVGFASSDAITSTLEVNGAATNLTAYNATADGTTIDFSKSNLAYTTNTGTSFTLTGMKDGGTYTLAIQANTAAAVSSFTAGSFTVKIKDSSGTDSGQRVYTIVCIGTVAYVYVTLFA
jgi:hypothetical protein